jgi:hypothetical protein
MNKKTIITILLALVAEQSSGQVIDSKEVGLELVL